MSKAPKIAIVGSVNLDFVVTTKTLPIAGETVSNGEFTALPGGKGSNVALTIHRLGAETELWACVGNDAYADLALETVRREGVDLSHITRLPHTPTGVAFINVSSLGENQIAVASGANARFPLDCIDTIEADAIVTQFEIPQSVIQKAISRTQALICINCSPVGPDLGPLLPYADLLIFNEGEFEFYEKQVTDFNGLIAITYGEQGAKLFKLGVEVAKATPIGVDTIDTTGAGDSFAGALTFALTKNMDLQDALQFACNTGAITTTKIGAQMAILAIDDIEPALARESERT